MRALIARYAVEWLMGRAERVVFVYGMRRSGNHAFIRWLANALEGGSAALDEGHLADNFYRSGNGSTVFINDIASMNGWLYLQFLGRNRKRLRRARFIIISCEDRDATYCDGWRIPRRCEAILVRRGALNIMASRFQNLNNLARTGQGSSNQTMNEKFFAVLSANRLMPRGLVWEFERWCSDESWRHQFLENLGLKHDISPAMSSEGGGSSFSGTRARPSPDQLARRFHMVEPQTEWIEFIRKSALEHPDVFLPDELETIRTMVDG